MTLKGFIKWYKEWKAKHDAEKKEYNNRQIEEKAEELFDVCVHRNALWLYCDGHFVCPMDMFKDCNNPTVIINMIRLYYITENKE